jgi:hypothetical protein
MDDRILRRVSSESPLQSLTVKELQRDVLPITRDPQPKPCKAWVRFGPHGMQVDALVVAWNDVACGIQFTVGDQQLRCWVWANAVTAVRTDRASGEQ